MSISGGGDIYDEFGNPIPMPQETPTPGGGGMGYPAQGIVPPAMAGTPALAALGGRAAFNAGLPRVTIPGTTLTSMNELFPGLARILAGLNPAGRVALTAGAIMQPTPTANDAAPTNMWNQRPSGVGGLPGPQVTNPPFVQPQHYPMWPTPPAPNAVSAPPLAQPARPVTPTPTIPPARAPAFRPAVATPPPAPSRVDLGYYTGSMGGPAGSAAGGARTPQFVPYPHPNDPRIYQGT